VWLHRGFQSRICLAFTGSLFPQALEAAKKLLPCTEVRQDRGSPLLTEGTEIDLYNLRFLKPVDEDYLADIMNNYDLVVFAEEGISSGGFGEYAAALARHRNCRAEIAVFAVSGDFASDGRALGTRDELLRFHGLDGNGIAEKIMGIACGAIGGDRGLGTGERDREQYHSPKNNPRSLIPADSAAGDP
jgi:1-deoxy-D-xylulose-5-phosphate synthase